MRCCGFIKNSDWGIMINLIKGIFGSRLYGTQIPSSDTDYKWLFMPSARDILLQQVKNTVQNNSGNDQSKNTSDDTDCEGFSLKYFLHLLSKGQTFAVEYMFMPKEFIIGDIHPCIEELFNNKDKLVSKQIAPFIGYTRRQASKYCIKSERMEAARMCMEFFAERPSRDLVHYHLCEFNALRVLNPFIEYVNKESVDIKTDKTMDMISCCGRKLPITATCKYAFDMCAELYNSYGSRAKAAVLDEGIDWKALYHALRIAQEAKDLLTEGGLLFPRPDAKLLLQVRNGELSYPAVSELLEKTALEVEDILPVSELRETVDHKWIEDYLYHWHYKSVMFLDGLGD